MATQRLCSIPDCGKVHEGLGLCKFHYQRAHKGRRLTAPSRNPPGSYDKEIARALIEATKSECWFWPYAKNSRGYGRISKSGKQLFVHRIVCARAHGSAPTKRHHAAHTCGNGHLSCINPHHLEWKTPSENEADKLHHKTSNRGERCGTAKLTTEDVLEIRRRYATKQVTMSEIANNFAVSQSTVSSIVRRTKWAWLP